MMNFKFKCESFTIVLFINKLALDEVLTVVLDI
jgi:hypothetical protein